VQAADGGCPATSDPSFAAVQRANDQAKHDKTTVLTDWNPVADRFGLPARDVKDIQPYAGTSAHAVDVIHCGESRGADRPRLESVRQI
jgi:hypothetical protein